MPAVSHDIMFAFKPPRCLVQHSLVHPVKREKLGSSLSWPARLFQHPLVPWYKRSNQGFSRNPRPGRCTPSWSCPASSPRCRSLLHKLANLAIHKLRVLGIQPPARDMAPHTLDDGQLSPLQVFHLNF